MSSSPEGWHEVRQISITNNMFSIPWDSIPNLSESLCLFRSPVVQLSTLSGSIFFILILCRYPPRHDAHYVACSFSVVSPHHFTCFFLPFFLPPTPAPYRYVPFWPSRSSTLPSPVPCWWFSFSSSMFCTFLPTFSPLSLPTFKTFYVFSIIRPPSNMCLRITESEQLIGFHYLFS